MERRYRGVGRCKCAFWFAVVHDIVGVSILLTGVFADIFCHDLFIYSGAVVIFLSLIWWVFWFSGNIEVPPEELQDDVGLVNLKNKGIRGVVRKVTGKSPYLHLVDKVADFGLCMVQVFSYLCFDYLLSQFIMQHKLENVDV
uniref:Uncharacterized protein n=1 Tax=Esox lucius TaxID=8010 RepID=A0A3P8YUX0_ESOLU